MNILHKKLDTTEESPISCILSKHNFLSVLILMTILVGNCPPVSTYFAIFSRRFGSNIR